MKRIKKYLFDNRIVCFMNICNEAVSERYYHISNDHSIEDEKLAEKITANCRYNPIATIIYYSKRINNVKYYKHCHISSKFIAVNWQLENSTKRLDTIRRKAFEYVMNETHPLYVLSSKINKLK